MFWESTGYTISVQNELVGPFPDLEVAKIFHILPQGAANFPRPAAAFHIAIAAYES